MSEHRCRDYLPKPRRWRRNQVRVCGCGQAYVCWKRGILAPTWYWIRWDR